MSELLVKGLMLGFSVAAPVGPIGLLCIKRSLSQGARAGIASGLGAAVADTLYGCVAALGLTVVSGFLLNQAFWLKLIGGLFLLILGWRTFRSAPAETAAQAEGQGLWGAFLSTLALTVTNPATILSFAALFAGTGFVADPGNQMAGLALVLGVFLGSAAWWLFLSTVAARFKEKMTPEILQWINRGSGLMLIAFGLLATASNAV